MLEQLQEHKQHSLLQVSIWSLLFAVVEYTLFYLRVFNNVVEPDSIQVPQ